MSESCFHCGQHKPCLSLRNEPVFIVNWNIFSWMFVILYCFSRMGACHATCQCWHLPSFYLSSDSFAYCFWGKYCLIMQSLAFKHCFFPTSHDLVRIEQWPIFSSFATDQLFKAFEQTLNFNSVAWPNAHEAEQLWTLMSPVLEKLLFAT